MCEQKGVKRLEKVLIGVIKKIISKVSWSRMEAAPSRNHHRVRSCLTEQDKGPGVRFSKVPVTFRAPNQIFKSKYKE